MKRNQLNQNGYRIGVAGGRPGFTLVEMLTVIVIIGILAALISAATIYARARAREAAIYTQIKQLESALMEYKNQFGEFPPDFAPGPNRVVEIERHIRRRWPRFQIDPSTGGSSTPFYDTLKLRLQQNYRIDLDELGPDSALVFWLGGLPDLPSGGLRDGDVYKPVGFHADEANPIQPGEPRTGKFFEFDPRVVAWQTKGASIVAIHYQIEKITSQYPTPVVYFRPYRGADGEPTYDGKLLPLEDNPLGDNHRPLPEKPNVCIAYKADTNEKWRNRDTFQLIHPGLDGEFGGPRPNLAHPVTVLGENFTEGDYDNITNFAVKLESEIQ